MRGDLPYGLCNIEDAQYEFIFKFMRVYLCACTLGRLDILDDHSMCLFKLLIARNHPTYNEVLQSKPASHSASTNIDTLIIRHYSGPYKLPNHLFD